MRLRAVMTAAACGLLALGWCATARAAEPDEAVRAHFAAIQAEDYSGADAYFSADFLAAFKADVEALNAYYSTRRTQLAAGYSVVAVEPLADRERDTARVSVDFNDPREDALRTVTERIHYYLIREKVPDGYPGRDSEGRAWRIDIYDAISFDTLADARRRAYLGTKQAWAEDEGRELRSKQGFFRIQWALGSFHDAKGRFPLRLLGGDNRRDELISEGYLAGSYPTNGFNGEPMKLQDFGEKSSGDYSYYSIDSDEDGKPDDYWLLLHGKVADNYYFDGHDTVYIANAEMDGSQAELAARFAEFWLERSGDELSLRPAAEPAMPSNALLPTQGMQEVLADARATQLSGQQFGDLPEDTAAAEVEEPGAAELAAAALAHGQSADDPAAGSSDDMALLAEEAPVLEEPALQILDEAVTPEADSAPGMQADDSTPAGVTRAPDPADAVPEEGPLAWLFADSELGGAWRVYRFGWD